MMFHIYTSFVRKKVETSGTVAPISVRSTFEVRVLKSSFQNSSLDEKKADECLLFFVS